MRNFDNWSRYLDNDNKPLHGCVQFMVKDGNTVAPIYDCDGTELDNPIITDIYGRTQHQVFIDADVRAYFYKYIGQGTWTTQLDIDTSDVSKWSLQYTSEDMDDSKSASISDAAIAIPTIQALRDVDPANIPDIQIDEQNTKKVITLLGYNEIGDKEPINYIFEAPSYYPDDGGSVIQSNVESAGQWIMVQPTEHCDSRHFGAFPQNSYNTADQTYQITKLFDYCQIHNIRPYFNGSDDYRWFRYSNLNVIANDIDVTNGTKFYDVGSNNTIQGNWHGDPLFYNANTNVAAENVKASWHAKTYTNAKNVIIDEITEQKNWQDAHIDVRVSPLFGYNFTHCTFEDNGNIGSDNVNNINNTFTNCKLNERMFITSGDYTVSLVGKCVNCQIDPDDFRYNMWLYKQIRQTMDPNPFFDYRDFNNVGNPYENYAANAITSNTIQVTNLKNAIAIKQRIYKLPNQEAIILENTTGWYELPADMIVIIKDSNVKLDVKGSTTLSVTNSTVDLNEMPAQATSGTNQITASFRDSTITGQTGVYESFTSYNSIVSAPVIARNSVVKDSQINQDLTLIPHDGVTRQVSYYTSIGVVDPTLQTKDVSKFISSFIDNNIFNARLVIDAQWGICPTHSTYPVNLEQCLCDNLVITNNISNVQDAWYIWPLVGAWAHDNLHHYVFKNNVGGFECSTTIPTTIMVSNTEQSNGILVEQSNNILGAYYTAIKMTDPTLPSLEDYIDDCTKYFTTMKLFTIGNRDVSVDLEITLTPDGTKDSYDINATGCSKGIAHLTDQAEVFPYYSTRFSNEGTFKVSGIRNVKTIPWIANWPVISPVEEFEWDPTWQIRNFVIGIANFENNTTCNITFKQIQ